MPTCGGPVTKLHSPFIGHSMRRWQMPGMIRTRFLVAGLTGLALSVAPAYARDDREAESARAAAEQGQVLPLGRLVAMVQARAPYRDMIYLGGPQFDARTMRYGLKFLDGNKVIVVFVDARTGKVVGRQP
jgi:uncharacterized iron-regulated membrane protein